MLRWRLPNLGFGFSLERGEKLRRHHFSRPLNHSLSDAGNRPTQLQVAGILYDGTFTFLLKVKISGSFYEPGRSFAGDDYSVMLRRAHIFKPDSSSEYSLDSPDAGPNRR